MKITATYVYPKSPPVPPTGFKIEEVSHVTESSGENPGWVFEDEVEFFARSPHSELIAFAVPNDWDGDLEEIMYSNWDKESGHWSAWGLVP